MVQFTLREFSWVFIWPHLTCVHVDLEAAVTLSSVRSAPLACPTGRRESPAMTWGLRFWVFALRRTLNKRTRVLDLATFSSLRRGGALQINLPRVSYPQRLEVLEESSLIALAQLPPPSPGGISREIWHNMQCHESSENILCPLAGQPFSADCSTCRPSTTSRLLNSWSSQCSVLLSTRVRVPTHSENKNIFATTNNDA